MAAGIFGIQSTGGVNAIYREIPRHAHGQRKRVGTFWTAARCTVPRAGSTGQSKSAAWPRSTRTYFLNTYSPTVLPLVSRTGDEK